ncbi:MAG: transcriptional regulator [Bacteroidetes bacterium]|nr:transcriptional regulator [Bacteroidota bacterium]
MTVDQFINLNEKSIPEEIFTEDKSVAERIKLISKLDKQERSVICKVIDSFLTKKKFKDFFDKNLSCS